MSGDIGYMLSLKRAFILSIGRRRACDHRHLASAILPNTKLNYIDYTVYIVEGVKYKICVVLDSLALEYVFRLFILYEYFDLP